MNYLFFVLFFVLHLFASVEGASQTECSQLAKDRNLKINIITYPNQAGLSRDVEFLEKELAKLGHSVHFADVRILSPLPQADINLFIELGDRFFFQYATKNYFLPHPEWCLFSKEDVSTFDLILCKTREAERIFKEINPNTLFLGFTCEDCYREKIPKNYKAPLHLAGKSIQKGTNALLKTWLKNPLFPTLILLKHFDVNCFPPASNINLISTYLSDENLKILQNQNALHICPSETEGFGYSIMEGLSSGAVVVTTNAPPMNEFVLDLRCLVNVKHSEAWRLATRYFADQDHLESVISNLLLLPRAELEKIGKKNRQFYLENDLLFRQRFAAIFNANAFFNASKPSSLANISDKKKQKTLAIFAYKDSRLAPWDPDSVKTGIIGSEEALIYMSQKLADLGYQVTVFANPPQNSIHSNREANPRFIDADKDDGTQFDIGVVWRMPWKGEELKKRVQKLYLWPHDTYQGYMTSTQADAFDDVLWLSEWQRQHWVDHNSDLAKFDKIFGNGINPNQFLAIQERKNPYACIYGSNYSRGLENLLDIWPQVKAKFPKATLDIYYGWNHWGLLSADKEAKMRLLIKILAPFDVQEHGSIGHEELNRAYEKASLWTYPCTLPETFCITALRAQLAGAVPVIIEGSALKETVRHGYKCTQPDDYCSTLLKAMEEAEKITLEDRKKMSEFILKEYTWEILAKKWKNLFDFHSSAPVEDIQQTENKTVLLAILARNKGHVLDRYLKCINNLDYDKKLITVYIKTDNNDDDTESILKTWIAKHGHEYRLVDFDNDSPKDIEHTKPHEWPPKRMDVLNKIRNHSLQKAKEHQSDYYFVVDCDNFIIPETLKDLIKKDKPIIAPMLRSIPEVNDLYTNYFYQADHTGYYKDHPCHLQILNHSMVGTFKVDVVHCTYLINSKYIDQLNYLDGSHDYDFIIFTRGARKNNIDQYICNEREYGVQIHYYENLTLEEEKNRVKALLTMP